MSFLYLSLSLSVSLGKEKSKAWNTGRKIMLVAGIELLVFWVRGKRLTH
jgi:hypothetical protein